MRFNDYLTRDEERYVYITEYFLNVIESFDKPSSVKVTKDTPSFFETAFSVNDKKYSFMADIRDKLAVVIFFPIDDELDLFKERKDKMYVGRVFASIFLSVEKLIHANSTIDEIGFVAEYKGLESLYKLMEPHILRKFPKWRVKEVGISNNGKLQYTYEKIER